MIEFLARRGSDRCVELSRVLLPRLRHLSQRFAYVAPDNKDHGVNVRLRCVAGDVGGGRDHCLNVRLEWGLRFFGGSDGRILATICG